ncbi:MAG: hypothetical protein B5M52_07290 [Helicobacteraceae bacterium 4484_230]|nr:MAG: hypothetical protein B5M52_07290 [Helicobacteraceae bacterium 4484_230]
MNSEAPTQNSEAVYVNPFLVFFTIFILPYLIFFALMVFVTGYTDPTLILESVIEKRGVEFIKIWIIGSFVMSVIATILISWAGITHIIKKGSKKTAAFSGGSVETGEISQPDYMPTISSTDKLQEDKEEYMPIIKEAEEDETSSLFAAEQDHEDVYENGTSRVFIVTPGTDASDAAEERQTKNKKRRYNMLDKYVSEKKGL